MLVVRVELHSALTGKITEIARAIIFNDGGSTNPCRGNYGVEILRGRDKAALDKRQVLKRGIVLNHARLDLHVWHLVAKALAYLSYGK